MLGRKSMKWSPQSRNARRFDELPRHFPLDFIHPRARRAPDAAESAAAQGRF
jgi:hypothetical protein